MILSSLIIFVLILIDQYSKYFVEQNIQNPVEFIPGIFDISYSQNTGIAFSMLKDFPMLLTIINTLVIVFFCFFYIRRHSAMLLENLPWLLIIAGGVSNLIDRYIKGYVVDFINPVFVDFAIFNLADVFLNIGVFILILELFFNDRKNQN